METRSVRSQTEPDSCTQKNTFCSECDPVCARRWLAESTAWRHGNERRGGGSCHVTLTLAFWFQALTDEFTGRL